MVAGLAFPSSRIMNECHCSELGVRQVRMRVVVLAGVIPNRVHYVDSRPTCKDGALAAIAGGGPGRLSAKEIKGKPTVSLTW